MLPHKLFQKLPPGKESLRPDHAPAIGAISKAKKDAPPPGSTRIILHPEHEGKVQDRTWHTHTHSYTHACPLPVYHRL